MKNISRGFTLVELIVVITILAILGTIAFISLQGYSADARNSKRISDLGNIETQAGVKVTQGLSLISFMNGDSLAIIPNHTIAGSLSVNTGATQDYNAGRVNYTSLGIRKEDFQDPNGSQDYAFGASIRADGKYQLAAKMEQGGGAFTVKVRGNYKPRNIADTTITVLSTGTNNTVNIGIGDVGKLISGDIVGTSLGNTPGTKVSKISGDGKILVLSSPVTATGALSIAENETNGMIDAGGVSTGVVVTDGVNFFPY